MKLSFRKLTALLLILVFTILVGTGCEEKVEEVTLDKIYSLSSTQAELDVNGSSALMVLDNTNGEKTYTTTWKSENPAVATVDQGFITGVSAGTTTIVATIIVQDKEPKELELKCTVTVKESIVPVSSISFTQATGEVNPGEVVALEVIFSPANATNKKVVWTSSDEEVATVNEGVVMSKSEGETTITATTDDGAKTATCVITVRKPVDLVEKLTISKTSVTITSGDTSTVEAVITPANALVPVLWSSSDEGVATVSNGVITALKAGTATITATIEDQVTTKTATCKVTVKKASSGGTTTPTKPTNPTNPTTPSSVKAKSVVLDKESITITVGEVGVWSFKATVSPSNTTEKGSWSSNNPSVASVDSSGNITVGSIGSKSFDTATIKYTIGSVSASGVVVVKAASPTTPTDPVKPTEPTTPTTPTEVVATSVSLNKQTLSLTVNKTEKLYATKLPAAAVDTLSWASSDASVASVASDGTVTAKKAGSAIITVTASKSGVKAQCTVTVTAAVATKVKASIVINPANVDLIKNQSVNAYITFSPAIPETAKNNLIYYMSTTNSTIVSVQQSFISATNTNMFIITALDDGLAEIICQVYDPSGAYTFEYENEYVNVNTPDTTAVTKPATGVTLDKYTATMTVDQTLTLNATLLINQNYGSTDDKVIWSSSNNKVAMVSSSGVVTAKKAGTATITAKLKSNNYVTTACSITVINSGEIGTNNTVSIIQGGSMQLVSKFGSNVMWSTFSPATVMSVSQSGLLTIPATAVVGSTGQVIAMDMMTGDFEYFSVVVKAMPSGSGTGSTISMTLGQPATYVGPTTFYVNNTTYWTTSTPSILSVNSTTGYVTPLAAGTGILIITNSSPFNTQTIQVNVSGATVSTYNLTSTTPSLTAFEQAATLSFTSTATALSGTISWSISSEAATAVTLSTNSTAPTGGYSSQVTLTRTVESYTGTVTVTATYFPSLTGINPITKTIVINLS